MVDRTAPVRTSYRSAPLVSGVEYKRATTTTRPTDRYSNGMGGFMSDLRPFKAAHVTGDACCAGSVDTDAGRLSGKWLGDWQNDASNVIYVVRHYSTPVAWVTSAGKIVIPDAYYSPTTTRVQNACRVALD